MEKWKVVIAGSSSRTVLCAEALRNDPRFKVTGALAPTAKPVGRNGTLTPSAVEVYARSHSLPLLFIDTKIDQSIQSHLSVMGQPDFLLVVDFGYLIPNWLLAWPKVAPINVHPSALPRWRGSSPGQFSLLYGEKLSAVTIMIVDAALDHGPILSTLPLTVQSDWTQTEYYAAAFALAAPELPRVLAQYAEGSLNGRPQPDVSPTAVAKKLSRPDGFIEWSAVVAAQTGAEYAAPLQSELLEAARSSHGTLASLIFAAYQALTPWPGLWTELETPAGKKRLKLLSLSLTTENTLELHQVQLEGKLPTDWQQLSATL